MAQEFSNENPRGRRIGVTVVLALVVAVAIVYYSYQFSRTDNSVPAVSEQESKTGVRLDFAGAINNKEEFMKTLNDVFHTRDYKDTLENLPSASEFSDQTDDDAFRLFHAAQLTRTFSDAEKSNSYLVRILDSNSPTFEKYKSIAAHSLISTFYIPGVERDTVVNALNSAVFMKSAIEKAKTFFPNLPEKINREISYPVMALHLSTNFIALSDRDDSFALPASAALELARAYIEIKKYPEMLEAVATETLIKEQLDSQLALLTQRYKARKESGYDNAALSGIVYDDVVGLSNLASMMEVLKKNGQINEFPILEDVDLEVVLQDALQLSKKGLITDVPRISYLYLRYTCTSIDSTDRKTQIDEAVSNLIGSPLNGPAIADKHLWIKRIISDVLERKTRRHPVYAEYAIEDIRLMSICNEDFRKFLEDQGFDELFEN